MKALKDFRILSLALLVTVAFGFEGLKQLQKRQEDQSRKALAKAEKIFSVQKEQSLQLDKKALAQHKVNFKDLKGGSIKFDLKAAISSYQKEHGLEEAKDGAKQKVDKLKNKVDDKKKKKVEYEYVWDAKNNKWVKRRKLTPEQRERLLAKRQEMLEKMKASSSERKLRSFAGKTSHAAAAVVDYVDGYAGPGQNQNSNAQMEQYGQNGENENSRSYEEWRRLLLERPDSKKLNEFINAYSAGQVSSDIFYQIAEDMINDSRIEMKEQGLTLAHNVPSAQSFRLLVKVLAKETGAIRASVERIMTQDYASMSGLSHLKKVMNSEKDTTVLIVATDYLSKAIQNLLSPPVNSSQASFFSDFIGLLTKLTQPDNESELIASASQTLIELQSRIGQGQQPVAALDSTPEFL